MSATDVLEQYREEWAEGVRKGTVSSLTGLEVMALRRFAWYLDDTYILVPKVPPPLGVSVAESVASKEELH